MSSNSLIILICGVVAVLVVIVLILFIGSRRKATRAGTSHTTPSSAVDSRATRTTEEPR